VGEEEDSENGEIANIPAEQLQRVNQNLFHQCLEHLHAEGNIFSTSCDL
jgi:hypothetical protein